MIAAVLGDLAGIKQQLASGADVHASDESGWTALRYGAASDRPEPVELLLRAGGKANQASLNDDTAIMVAAAFGRSLEPLHAAGADINHQNRAGVAALMHVASKANSTLIAEALRLGADPTLKDASGRTAVDYAKLSDCGKNPLGPDFYQFATPEPGKCGLFDRSRLNEVVGLLEGAMSTKKNQRNSSPRVRPH